MKSYKTRVEMKGSLDAAIDRFKDKDMKNYFDCIKPYLARGMKRELYK